MMMTELSSVPMQEVEQALGADVVVGVDAAVPLAVVHHRRTKRRH